MEANAPKLNLTVHLGEDKGQPLLAKVDFTNHVGHQAVSYSPPRLNSLRPWLK